jgi:hypothetical protein
VLAIAFFAGMGLTAGRSNDPRLCENSRAGKM